MNNIWNRNKRKHLPGKPVRIGRVRRSPALFILAATVATMGIAALIVGHALTPTASIEPETGTANGVTVGNDSTASAGKYAQFNGSGTVGSSLCAPAGTAPAPPATYNHIVWIWMENKSASQVLGTGITGNDFELSLKNQCGYSAGFLDNIFGSSDLPSRPHYLAATSGSNCNSGLSASAAASSGCQTDDSDATAATQLNTVSLLEQIQSAGKTWKSYQESSPSPCSFASGSDGTGNYRTKHDPAPYYSRLGANCAANDVPFAGIACTASACPTPGNNQLVTDINNGTLPAFAIVTPNMCNDTHDCSVAIGDQWLKKYVNMITNGPNYKAGGTAVFIMWDESTPGIAQPNLFISPYTPPTNSTVTMNLFAVLRAAEQMLGLTTYLGCAGGTIPGSAVSCPAGSTANVRSAFNL
jgi:hypothetical protein